MTCAAGVLYPFFGILSKKGVLFTAYDVKTDKEALKEMKRISGGALRVPVISVCNEVMVGFDRGRLEQALAVLNRAGTGHHGDQSYRRNRDRLKVPHRCCRDFCLRGCDGCALQTGHCCSR